MLEKRDSHPVSDSAHASPHLNTHIIGYMYRASLELRERVVSAANKRDQMLSHLQQNLARRNFGRFGPRNAPPTQSRRRQKRS